MRTVFQTTLGAFAVLVYSLTTACGGSDAPKPVSGDAGSVPTTSEWRAAVGSGGTLVQTLDNAAWATRSVAPLNLFAVACNGNYRGWATGSAGFVAHTEDGGNTWTTEDSHLTSDLHAIHFGDANHGVLAGDHGALAVTMDGGVTWRTIANQADATFGAPPSATTLA